MSAQVPAELIDDVMEAYVEWREECVSAMQAYERWSSFPVHERRLAFAAYQAALDREHAASIAYSSRIAAVERELTLPRRLLRSLCRRITD